MSRQFQGGRLRTIKMSKLVSKAFFFFLQVPRLYFGAIANSEEEKSKITYFNK